MPSKRFQNVVRDENADKDSRIVKHSLDYVKHFTKFAKIVCDYRRSIRHRRKGLWGDTRPSVLTVRKACFFAAEGEAVI